MQITETEIQKIVGLVQSYFPHCHIEDDGSCLETKDKSEIIFQKQSLLPYLQTMLFEEHLIEIQVDQGTRLFFAYILDDFPLLQNNDLEEGKILEEKEYEPGSYLKESDYFLMSPATPGIGNLKIRNSKLNILRFFTGTTAIELGCTFRKQTSLNEVPVLCFDFPHLGKITRNFRTFRIKALTSIEARVRIRNCRCTELSGNLYQISDVSAEGLAFEVPGDKQLIHSGEIVSLTVMVKGFKELDVRGQIRNVTDVRNSKGYKAICGIQFDLETRALATELEKMAAAIQRLHLRELAERTADLNGVRIIR